MEDVNPGLTVGPLTRHKKGNGDIMMYVTVSDYDVFINGGYIPTDNPNNYNTSDVITDGMRYCVWHNVEVAQ
jgi:hypothetical protein